MEEELDELDEELEEDFFLSIFSGFSAVSDFDKKGSKTASLTAVKAFEKSSANEFSIFVSPTWLIIFSFFSFSGSRSLSDDFEDSGISGTGMVSSGGFGRGLSGA